MGTFLDICEGEKKSKNTGFKDQCIETKLQIPVLSNGFEFASVQAFKTKSAWKDAIAAKSLVPLFEVYELADASTEDTKFESGNFSKITAKGVEKITFECYLSICAYAALKSYENNGQYGEIFEFNEGGDYSGVFAADGTKVKGRKIKSITVTRIRATKDKVPYVKGEITYADKDDILDGVIVKSDLEKDDLDGIFDVTLKLVSASSTVIKLTAASGCSGNSFIKSLVLADFKVRNAAGVAQTVTLVPADEDGVYQLIGTGFATGYTVEVDGVVQQTNIMYEGVEKLPVTVTP